MEEPTTIFGLSINEIVSILETILIVFAITAIITILYFKLRKYNSLFKRLSIAFRINNRENNDPDKLVEEIIHLQKQREFSNHKISEKATNFIQSGLDYSKVYIHFTSKKKIADLILKEGFKYSDSIYKTSQEVLGNTVDLTYKLQLYKPYGKYLIVLSIPKALFDFSKELTISNRQYSLVDNVLSQYNPEEDLEYTLPPMFVRGYIDIDNNTIVKNEYFLSDFNFDNYKNKILEILK